MIAETGEARAAQGTASVNFEAVVEFHDLGAHRTKIVRDRGDAISFLHAQFLGMTNDGGAAGERAGDSENRQLIDQWRNLFSLDDRSFEVRADDFQSPARLDLIDIRDRLADLRTHAHEHSE